MPKGRPKKIIEQDLPQPEGFTQFLTNKLKDFEERLERLATGNGRRLDEIENRLLKIETDSLKKEIAKSPVQVPISVASAPIPSDYLDLITSILNSKFQAKIDYFTDRPQFMLTIMVPDEYSTQKPDLRSKVIDIASGINGVREWLNLVYSSFDPETKARIKSAI